MAFRRSMFQIVVGLIVVTGVVAFLQLPRSQPVSATENLDRRFGAFGSSNQFGAIASTGLGVVRTQIAWKNIEPVQGEEYKLASVDALVSSAEQQGLELLVTVRDAPTWAVHPDFAALGLTCGPLSPEGYEAFGELMGTLADRYESVKYWEMANEPDNEDGVGSPWLGGCWGQHPEDYAELLKAAYPAVKAANPDAKVVFGGLAHERFSDMVGKTGACQVLSDCPFNRKFLEKVLEAGGGPYFDTMNFHYYPAFRNKWEEQGKDIIGKYNALNQVLIDNGFPNKSWVVTETGAWSGPLGNGSEEWQASYVPQVASRALAIGVENLIWFWTQDEPPQTPCDASPTDYDYMLCAGHGLYDKDGKPKKAVTAFKVFFEKTEGLTHVRALGPGNGIPEAAEGYEFSEAAGSGTGPNGARKRVWVVWVTPDITKSRPIAGKDPKANDNYTPLDITLSTKPLSISDYLGNALSANRTLTLTPDPIYLEMPPILPTKQFLPLAVTNAGG